MPDVVVYSDLGRYGAGRAMASIATLLVESGLSVEVATFNPNAVMHPLRDPRWTLAVLDPARGAPIRQWWRYLRRVRPGAILMADHRFAAAPALTALLAARRARRVVVLHREPEALLRGGGHMTSARLAAWRALLRGALGTATGVVTVGNAVRQGAARWLGLPPDHFRTIYNPVLTPAVAAAARRQAGHPWLDQPDRPVIVGVGRLAREKDWATLLRAFAVVRRTVPARLLLLGEGPERRSLERLTADLGLFDDVALLGEVGNPHAFISRAAVLGHASVDEGLPTVLIEALGLGTPVVAANCPCGPAEILEGGRWGRLVPPRDAGAMAAALLAAMGDRTAVDGAKEAAWARFAGDGRQYREILGFGAPSPSGRG